MRKIFLSAIIFISISSFAQEKYFDHQRIDSLYGKFSSGASTDSVVTVNANGKFRMRNASAFGGISGITADNGLTASTSTNVQLGGTLLQNTSIDASSFILTITKAGLNQALNVVNTGGQGLGVSGTSIGAAIQASGTNPLWVIKSSGSTSTVERAMLVQKTSTGATSSGVGVSIDFGLTNGSNSTNAPYNQLISKLTTTTAGSEVSQFIITGVNSGVTGTIVTMDGDGTSTFLGGGAPTNTVRAINTTGTGVKSETTTGTGIWSIVSSTGIGIQANSVGNVALAAIRTPSSTNTVVSVIQANRQTTGTAGDGIGASFDFYLQDASGGGASPYNQLISKLTDATNKTSQLSITGVTSNSTQTWLTIGQSGYVKFRPMTVTEAGALTPAEGLMVFVSNTDATFTSIGLWIYQNSAWKAL